MSQANPLDPQSLDVTELEDSDLEGVAGGLSSDQVNNTGCPTTINNNC